MSSREEVLAAALALPRADRRRLMDDLRQADGDDELSPAQRAELRRRIAALDAGGVESLDGEAVLRSIIESSGRR